MTSTYYLLECLTPIQCNRWYVYNNLTDIKKSLMKSLSDVGMIQMFIGEQSTFLYIVKEGRLISKINVKSWISVRIEDIYELTFNPDPVERFLSEDEQDKTIIKQMDSCLQDIKSYMSKDLTEILIQTQLIGFAADGFDAIKIHINYPQIPHIEGNLCDGVKFPLDLSGLPAKSQIPHIEGNLYDSVKFPLDWSGLPAKSQYTDMELKFTTVLHLYYGDNE